MLHGTVLNLPLFRPSVTKAALLFVVVVVVVAVAYALVFRASFLQLFV